MPRLLLKVKDTAEPKQVLEFNGETVTMGRSRRCTLKVPDAKISRVHCAFEQAGGVIKIRDLNSKNGIKVNGKRVPSALLNDGDVVLVGNTVCLFQK